jgi:hypothetical protein
MMISPLYSQLDAHETVIGPVHAAINNAAPHVRIRFAPKRDTDSRLLREGLIDLQICKGGLFASEVRTQFPFRDQEVGIARVGYNVSGKCHRFFQES